MLEAGTRVRLTEKILHNNRLFREVSSKRLEEMHLKTTDEITIYMRGELKQVIRYTDGDWTARDMSRRAV